MMIAHIPSPFSSRLQSNLGKKLLLDGSTLARFASQMQTFQDSAAVVSSLRLLRCVMATESIKLVPFIESKEFCKQLSKIFIAIVCIKVLKLASFITQQVQFCATLVQKWPLAHPKTRKLLNL